ncbi:hypothetical protein WN944_018353 [Citrus x changshan-huyou]|uniref:Uncharacterized protein n=1 Tax=Citrus x changshan-huyou TaxID=2935761 RepID=A0AAP0QFC9_9ROSI
MTINGGRKMPLLLEFVRVFVCACRRNTVYAFLGDKFVSHATSPYRTNTDCVFGDERPVEMDCFDLADENEFALSDLNDEVHIEQVTAIEDFVEMMSCSTIEFLLLSFCCTVAS